MKHAGFTLVELVVSIVVLAAISAMALPPLGALIDSQRRLDAAQQIASGIRTARTEAIMRSQVVTIHGIEGDWGNGWRIIADLDGKGPDEDDLVLIERAASGQTRVVGNKKVQSHISFNNLGGLLGSGNGSVYVCLKDQPVSHYRVIVALNGRVRIENKLELQELCA